MVTIAQGKFSKPRPPRPEDPIKPVRKIRPTVAADPIEKAEADISKFMDTAMNEPVSPETSRATDATVVVPDVETDATRVIPTVGPDATQVVPDHEYITPEGLARPHVENRTVPQSVIPDAPEFDEEDYEEEPTFFQKHRKPILIGGCITVLLLIVLIVCMVISLNSKDYDNGRILDNVIVAGVDVGGMTPEKAKIAIYNATVDTYDSKSMEVHLPDTILTFSPEDTGITLDVDAAVDAAFKYGRVGTEEEIERAKAQSLVGQYVLDLIPYLQLDAEYIHRTLKEYSDSFTSDYLSSSYTFEGTKPSLTADTFDPETPCETLVLNIGTPGRNLDAESIYTSVMTAYSNNIFEVNASEAPEEMPELPDLDAIFEEYCSTPVDAYMDMQTFEITGEIYGYTFDLEKAKELLSDAEFGTSIRIEMEYIIPEVTSTTLTESLYSDVLGTCQTKLTSNENRNTNIKLACQAINGLILYPGDEFDYNKVVGQRTAERGYRAAPAYSSGKTVQELGGGICQVSSTLYYSVLLADIEVTDRTNHSYVSTYIDKGMDATVSWGGPEFKFRNNTSYPILITAEVIEDYLQIQLLGTDEKDYYVEMEFEIIGHIGPKTVYEEYEEGNSEGYTDGQVIQNKGYGYYVDTYKHKIDKVTGEEISVEYCARSVYKAKDEIIVKIIKKAEETQAPTEKPTEKPAEKPTQAPTAAPTVAPTKPPAPATEAPTPATEVPTPATEAPTPATEAAA